MRKAFLCLAAGIFSISASAQTLFTFGGTPVSKQEFLRVYQKNSMNKTVDMSNGALRDYLDLYSLFRMKVREAELQQLDTLQNVAMELDGYRRQLTKTYMTDKQVSERLVREAYDRSREELHVQHIMIAVPSATTSKDTLMYYRKADSLYKVLSKGKVDFGTVAKSVSEDRGSRDQGGDIGYMTSLQTVYPFENAAYTTPVGKISRPFRTQFGYHILKVISKRPARGEVIVAQILISSPKSAGPDGVVAARRRMDSVRYELRNGASFESLVTKYSEDKYTKNSGGVLEPFNTGRYSTEFEDAAFGLKNPGDLSAPVQTEYGIHLLKLVGNKPMLPFDSVRDATRRRVDNDSRAQIARDEYFNGIKQKNGFKENTASLTAVSDRFGRLADTGVNAGVFTMQDFGGLDATLFSLGTNNYTQADFVNFAGMLTRGRITGPRSAVVNDIYRLYVERTVNDYQEHRLAEENPDFRNLMEEYRNGILLFELMDRNVWGRATRDTVGLKEFYNGNKTKYQWEPGFTGAVYHFKDEASMNKAMKLINGKKPAKDEDVYRAANTEAMPDAVNIQRGHFEFGRFTDVPRADIQKGKLSKAVKNGDGTYTAVYADDVFITNTQKTLDEARGYAVAEYQDALEKEWNATLRAKYPVKVEEPVFQSMVGK